MYAAGNLTVDMDKRQVLRGKEMVALTPTEFRLLQCLIQKRGQPVSESSLAQEVWGTYRQTDSAVVRRYIWLLRQKLEDDPAHPARILTVRGFGYRLGTAPLTTPKDATGAA
jgi:two-component system KDP operon response regulator KdpE